MSSSAWTMPLEAIFSPLYFVLLSFKLYTLIKARVYEFGESYTQIAVVCLPAIALVVEYYLEFGWNSGVLMRHHRPLVHVADLSIQSLIVFKVVSSVYRSNSVKAILSFLKARADLAPSVYC